MKYCIVQGVLSEDKDLISKIEDKGKIIYEVIRIINGVPLFFKEHMCRLEHTYKIMNIESICSHKIILGYIRELCVANNILEGNIKIIISSLSREYAMYFIPHVYPTEEQYDCGVRTILYYGERNNPNAKVQDNGFRNKVMNKVAEANAYEAILVDRNGYITEGSKSNIFMIKNNLVMTAPVNGVLAGITRLKIMEVINNMGITLEERYIHENNLKEVDALFISGTSPKILPVNSVNNLKFDCGNNIIRGIMKQFEICIKKDIDNLRDVDSKGKLIIK